MIIGFDVSTSCTGYCILDNGGNLLELGHVKFKSVDFWKKADEIKSVIDRLSSAYSDIDHIVIEESLQNFRAGFSSAKTITTLAKFNAIVSYLARDAWKRDIEYIASISARKLCGIKIDKALDVNSKVQVLNQVVTKYLTEMRVQYTKHGNVLSWQLDEIDAYVVAKSKAISLNSQKPPKK